MDEQQNKNLKTNDTNKGGYVVNHVPNVVHFLQCTKRFGYLVVIFTILIVSTLS